MIEQDLDVCPSCGNFALLNDDTGWCVECSPPTCIRCGGNQIDHRNGSPYKSESKVTKKNGKWYCTKCLRELWIEKNADIIEEYMLGGISYTEARAKVQVENRAICIICSSPIPSRNRSETLFCTRTKECRKAKRKYLWRIQHKRLTPEDALEEILREEAI